jgi:hypothetical protein
MKCTLVGGGTVFPVKAKRNTNLVPIYDSGVPNEQPWRKAWRDFDQRKSKTEI